MDIENIKKGDLIKVKIACWGEVKRGWRKVTGNIGTHLTIRCNGISGFMVRPNEIIDVRPSDNGDGTKLMNHVEQMFNEIFGEVKQC